MYAVGFFRQAPAAAGHQDWLSDVRVPIGPAVETGHVPSQKPFQDTNLPAPPRGSSSRVAPKLKNQETPHAASLPEIVPFPLPWVLKPLALSGSRGVIRANTLEEV